MAGVVLDGKKVSQDIIAELKAASERNHQEARASALSGCDLVGEDPASQIYVRNKIKASEELGIRSVELKLPGTISTDDLFQAADPIIKDKTVDAILVQMPLPPSSCGRRK